VIDQAVEGLTLEEMQLAAELLKKLGKFAETSFKQP